MQTRKRAKSISFGKPKKVESDSSVHEEKEVAASDVVEKATVASKADAIEKTAEVKEPTEAAKKVLDIEAEDKPKEEKEETPELSDTPEVEDKKEAIVPADDFLTDTEPDKAPKDETPKEEPVKDELSSGLSPTVEPTLSTPIIEPEAKTETPSVLAPETPLATEDLSPTPPASAFSLQEGGGDGIGSSEGKKRNFLVYFLVIALFSFILGIGAMALLTSGLLPVSLPKEIPLVAQLPKALNASPTAVPTEKPVPTVAPTEKPLNLDAYTISVLNGSGIKGKAATVKTSLTAAGFKVGTTGNASTSDFEATEVSAKKNVDEAYLEKLKAELGKDFKVEINAAPAPASQASDVVVTIGSDTAK